jgi:hypothetical protein
MGWRFGVLQSAEQVDLRLNDASALIGPPINLTTAPEAVP